MKIRHIAIPLLCMGILLTNPACSDFTEIDAKGNNLLSSVNDLELLLNAEYDLYSKDMFEVCGDAIYSYNPFSIYMNVAVPTAKSIRMSWDENLWVSKLPELTSSDTWYTTCYRYIGRIANPILQKVDAASGDTAQKEAIKAEAYVIRAFFHYMVIQKFAPAYNPATAENTVALPYMTEDMDIKIAPLPVSLKEFYDHIISDLDNAIALDAIPEKPLNQMRFGKACLYSVKALAYMAMQEYSKASDAAKEALKVNGEIYNYYNNMGVKYISKDDLSPAEPYPVICRPKLNCPEDYFSFNGKSWSDCITPYTLSLMEPCHVYTAHLPNYALGKSLEDTDIISVSKTGEHGYLISNFREINPDSWLAPAGLRSSQMYLVLAECALHRNDLEEAAKNLDIIRENRSIPELYEPISGKALSKTELIRYYKMTAGIDNLFTIWNFVDRKRWTQLPEWKETITRTICGREMSLTPDSKLWVFPIPRNVINNNPNLKPFMN